MANKFLNEAQKAKLITDREKAIIKNFNSTFNKIKHLSESAMSDSRDWPDLNDLNNRFKGEPTPDNDTIKRVEFSHRILAILTVNGKEYGYSLDDDNFFAEAPSVITFRDLGIFKNIISIYNKGSKYLQ